MSRVEATLAEFYRGETIPSGRYAGQPDFTNAWQIAHDRLADGSINELIIPNGTFNITAPAEVDVEFFTGKKIFGQSWAGSIIRQLTDDVPRSEAPTAELQSLMSNAYADFCMQQNNNYNT